MAKIRCEKFEENEVCTGLNHVQDLSECSKNSEQLCCWDCNKSSSCLKKCRTVKKAKK